MKILIVDDSAFMRTILKNIILGSRYNHAEVIEAAGGEEAIAQYRAINPDLVLLDIIMPGKDGMAVLKELGPDAKSVVIISSIDQPNVIEEAKALGAKGYIIKPYDDSQVIAMLDNLV
jgi:two-component system chemotaxis response regulator CheY